MTEESCRTEHVLPLGDRIGIYRTARHGHGWEAVASSPAAAIVDRAYQELGLDPRRYIRPDGSPYAPRHRVSVYRSPRPEATLQDLLYLAWGKVDPSPARMLDPGRGAAYYLAVADAMYPELLRLLGLPAAEFEAELVLAALALTEETP